METETFWITDAHSLKKGIGALHPTQNTSIIAREFSIRFGVAVVEVVLPVKHEGLCSLVSKNETECNTSYIPLHNSSASSGT